MYICVRKLNHLSFRLWPSRRQAIICTNAGILLIIGTNYSEVLIEIHTFLTKKKYLKMSPGKCRSFCLGLNKTQLASSLVLLLIYYQHCVHSYDMVLDRS